MPIIQCDIREGRTPEQKAALAREITRVVSETIDAPVEYIYVLMRHSGRTHPGAEGRAGARNHACGLGNDRCAGGVPTC